MAKRKSIENKTKQSSSALMLDDAKLAVRRKIERLCKCDRILSDTESDIVEFGNIAKFNNDHDDCGQTLSQNEECIDDLEDEYLGLIKKLNLSVDTYSLTKIETNLAPCMKYGFRSGLTHMNMKKFSPLSRGYQGPASAVAAIATSHLIKPNCWNEPVIDRVIEDGDAYFSSSYKLIKTDDRRTLTLLDLKRNLDLRKTHRAYVIIDDPIYAGTFKSETPKELHVAKALDMFFKNHDAGILTSSVLNVAIWKSSECFNIFDAQARLDNCEVAKSEDESGTAKIIFVENLAGVLFIILEKSSVENEPFLLYGITIDKTEELASILDDEHISLEEPQRRPSGYRIQEKYRAICQGSFHLHHHLFPQEFHGRGHLILAVATLVYSKLLSAHKWTNAVLDVIFNQSNIYLTDLARVLGKPLDDSFELKISDLLADVILGVYTAKIKVQENVIPGEGKKGKAAIDSGLRDFFEHSSAGIIEIKKTFFAIWEKNDKYYLFDPFACDNKGFRVDATDPDEAERYASAASCVTMNSSIDQLLEIILENTESKEKDPFVIHSLDVLYVKTSSAKDGSDEQIVFRKKKTNRRPEHPPSPPVEVDECAKIIDTLPRPRVEDAVKLNEKVQYPEAMNQVEKFVETYDEEKCPYRDTRLRDEQGRIVFGYKVKSPYRLLLEGTKNCLSQEFNEFSQGRQGLVIALAAITKAKLLNTTKWTSAVLNKIIVDANFTYEEIVHWIHAGGNGNAFYSQIQAESFVTEKSNMGLNYLDLKMLPETINIDNVDVNLSYKMNIAEGESNPLANLGESLERYFEQFDELILENKKMFYSIWREHKKYFVLNPYGSNKYGWRDNIGPAVVAVVDSINELVNFFYGVLEFNDYHFVLHFVKVNVLLRDEHHNEEHDEQFNYSPFFEPFEKYVTTFLPVTDADLQGIKKGKDLELRGNYLEMDEGERGIEYGEEDMSSSIEEHEDSLPSLVNSEDGEQFETLTNMFEKRKEPIQPNPPPRLNLSLVTGIVKIRHSNESFEKVLDIFYEKLKYRHPPPFVTPPQKNLCDLLDAKLASKSMHSLISRFSIDSRLMIKEINDIAQSAQQDATINFTDDTNKSKLITLPPTKYLYSKSLPNGLTPIRAIDEKYIQDKEVDKQEEEDCRKKKSEKVIVMMPGKTPDDSTSVTLPSIIPLGPCIATPKFKRKVVECPEKRKKKCLLSERDKENVILRRIVCSTENVLLELLLPEIREKLNNPTEVPSIITEEKPKELEVEEVTPLDPEPCGFSPTDDEDVGIIRATMSLKDPETVEETHYKPCFFAAILCILAKININVYDFRSTILDRLVFAANKIGTSITKLRIKMTRCFRNFNILDFRYNVIVKQVRYGDPEHHQLDSLENLLMAFFCQHQTGILVFGNVAYAFWLANDISYLFDPYACDENGRRSEDGSACLLKICDFDSLVDRIIQNTGEPSGKPYRLYTISITHFEQKKKRRAKKKRTKSCEEEHKEKEEDADNCADQIEPETIDKPEASLIELANWTRELPEVPSPDVKLPGFLPIKNYKASAIEVSVLENDITRPVLTPIKTSDVEAEQRCLAYDRKFSENSVLAEPVDLCVIAWSQIYEPPLWSERTIRALFEAGREYSLNSIFASKDSSVPQIWDNLMSEFGIANFSFRVVFTPMHVGTLYANEGWNLAASLKKIFECPVYSGAVLVCGSAHVGIMRKGGKMYAWWLVRRTKNIRIVVSEDMEDYLKIIIKEINEPAEATFAIRIVTISYAKMIGPNCSDLEGLHESMMPSTSIPEIHTKEKDLSLSATFRPTDKHAAPIFILGNVALSNRDLVTEPRVKRCYFAALLAVVLKRDIVQSPMPEMIDKILKLADSLYKLFKKPKYHAEHILKDVNLNERVFDLRDCASDLASLQDEKQNVGQDVYSAVKAQLKQFLKKYSSGVIHFTNCCYGFWYSEVTRCYYYLDPYQCSTKGKRVEAQGSACLCIFASMYGMAKQMCVSRFKDTTGFFIHRIHVEAVNPSGYDRFQEDPVWSYLDYHWSYRHVGRKNSAKSKQCKDERDTIEKEKKPMLKNYFIEVPSMIYSLWGTVGSFDVRFAARAGKNQAAIGVVMLALQNVCQPSEWNSALLDSAVICGDSFYKESKKLRSLYLNKFDLSECLKITPYLWSVQFVSDMCGVLYGNRGQPSLAERVEQALEKSPNLLIQCEKKILAVMRASDALYAVDSSWTGPPLFSKNRGAIYAVRCVNLNTLVYVLMKMFNTNRKLDFVVTPVRLSYKQVTPCSTKDSKSKIGKRKLLEKPVRTAPGFVVDHLSLVSGSDTVSDEDSYLRYSRNLKMGLERKKEYETLSRDVGRKKIGSLSKKKMKVCKKSSSSILYKNTEYPRVVDLAKLDVECDTWSWDRKFDIETSFVCDETRHLFDNYNDQMQKPVYKTIKHKIDDSEVVVDEKDLRSLSNATMSKVCEGIGDLDGSEESAEEAVDGNEDE